VEFLDYLNPLKSFSEEEYMAFWRMLFANVLHGFLARAIASTALILSFWFGIKRRQLPAALMCYAFALVIAYGAAILELFF